MSTRISSEPAGAIPADVSRLAEAMAGYGRPWSLCGGWAVDAWLGRITRDHGDVDLSVFDADHQELADHLAGWQLIAHTPSDGGSSGLWDGRLLPVPSHLHGRAPQDAGPLPTNGVCQPAEGWWLDIQIDGREGNDWVLRQRPHVALPMRAAVRMSPWGVPATAPEALLFFKAAEPRRRDWRDFVALLPGLDAEQLAWLGDAMSVSFPQHPWIDALAWVASMPRSA